jgi:hypothetical protein
MNGRDLVAKDDECLGASSLANATREEVASVGGRRAVRGREVNIVILSLLYGIDGCDY